MTTIRAAVASALRQAARYDGNAQVAPAAVLWPDPDRQWEQPIAHLSEAVPIATLGPWAPELTQGPAIWLRTLLTTPPPSAGTWVVYLPGVGVDDLRHVESVDRALAPLVELQFRSVWWRQGNSQPWSPAAFLRSPDGLKLDIGKDAQTSDALGNALLTLLDQDVEMLRRAGRIDSAWLNSLLTPDDTRTLLRWLDDPAATKSAMSPAQWKAFRGACATKYGIDPGKDTPISGAEHLGQRQGAWAQAWNRFAEAPRAYSNIPALLDQARPAGALFGEDDPHPDSWPSVNADAEIVLRSALTALSDVSEDAARTMVRSLDAEHAPRRDDVWAVLGQSALAIALEQLAATATLTEKPSSGSTVRELAELHADRGWRVDDHAMRALAAATAKPDRAAVGAALHALYSPWLDRSAEHFQQRAVSSGYPGQVGLEASAGTCVVFVDGLRYDVGQRLATALTAHGFTTRTEHRLAPFPTVTPTGQPAVAPLKIPVCGGPGFAAADSQGRSLSGAGLHKALAASGAQRLLPGETGDPAGVAWTQVGDLDKRGHDLAVKLVDDVDAEVSHVADRVGELLGGGWPRVVVVTDHGWLLSPRPLRKVELPLHLTEGEDTRKNRTARLIAGATEVAYPALPWTWDANVTMVSAPGTAAFAQGVYYDHGGLSAQECVIPVITVTAGSVSAVEARIENLRWTGLRCRVDIAPPLPGLAVEVRLAPGDARTTIAGPKPVDDGEAKVLVTDDTHLGQDAHVVLIDDGGDVIAQRRTQVGEGA